MDTKQLTCKMGRPIKGHEGETLLSATIFLNGQKLIYYRNGDWGGEPHIEVYDTVSWNEVEAWIDTLPDYETKISVLKMNASLFFEMFVTQQYVRNGLVSHIKRAHKKGNILFTHSKLEADEYRELTHGYPRSSEVDAYFAKAGYTDVITSEEDGFIDTMMAGMVKRDTPEAYHQFFL